MSRKTVLLVDDVKMMLEIEISFLKRENFFLITAQSGSEALSEIRNMKPDLVLLDLHMPDMNGDEVCRIVKADPELKDTKVVLVTGTAGDEALANLAAAGCDEILTKPFNRSQLLGIVQNLLGVSTRQDKRVDIRIPCTVNPDSEALPGTIVNLSVSGAFIHIDPPLSRGQVLVAGLELPGPGHFLRLKAIVRWTSSQVDTSIPPGIGIEFLDISDDEINLLDDLIDESLKDF